MSIERVRDLIENAIEFAKSPPDYGCDDLNEALTELEDTNKDFERDLYLLPFLQARIERDRHRVEENKKLKAENKRLTKRLDTLVTLNSDLAKIYEAVITKNRRYVDEQEKLKQVLNRIGALTLNCNLMALGEIKEIVRQALEGENCVEPM